MYKKEIQILREFVSLNRQQRFEDILEYRTRYVTVVLEDIFQSHNASAVLRTCDLFGVQDVHIIENENEYNINPDVAVGSYKWLNIKKHNTHSTNTLLTLQNLKQQGYRIIATSPHRNSIELNDFNINGGKFALVFGAEMPGITDTVVQNADEFLRINMFGFTESFNISVSVAIILHELIRKIHRSSVKWELSEHDRQKILYEWLKKSVKNADKILNLSRR